MSYRVDVDEQRNERRREVHQAVLEVDNGQLSSRRLRISSGSHVEQVYCNMSRSKLQLSFATVGEVGESRLLWKLPSLRSPSLFADPGF